jgi:hypothetical protein
MRERGAARCIMLLSHDEEAERHGALWKRFTHELRGKAGLDGVDPCGL